MVPLLRYTVLRLALFVAALGLFAVLGARGMLLLVLAAAASLALSYVLLRRPRDEVARLLQDRVRGRLGSGGAGFARGLAEDADAEDADAEDAAGGEPSDRQA